MAKEAYYFSHDFGSRNDPKLQKVLMKHTQAGKGVFWDLIEMLHEEGGKLLLSECDSYAFALRTHTDLINSLINDFGLFEKDELFFWSNSANRRINDKNLRSEKARQSAINRWSNNANASNNNANASKIDAIKERKGKERKGKENKREEEVYIPTREECINFFLLKNFEKSEGEKFYLKYEGIGWEISGSKIKSWESVAEAWILKIPQFDNAKNQKNHKNGNSNQKLNPRSVTPAAGGYGKL